MGRESTRRFSTLVTKFISEIRLCSLRLRMRCAWSKQHRLLRCLSSQAIANGISAGKDHGSGSKNMTTGHRSADSQATQAAIATPIGASVDGRCASLLDWYASAIEVPDALSRVGISTPAPDGCHGKEHHSGNQGIHWEAGVVLVLIAAGCLLHSTMIVRLPVMRGFDTRSSSRMGRVQELPVDTQLPALDFTVFGGIALGLSLSYMGSSAVTRQPQLHHRIRFESRCARRTEVHRYPGIFAGVDNRNGFSRPCDAHYVGGSPSRWSVGSPSSVRSAAWPKFLSRRERPGQKSTVAPRPSCFTRRRGRDPCLFHS